MRKRRPARRMLPIGFILLLLLTSALPETTEAAEGSLDDSADIAEFVDQTLEQHVDEHDLAGVVVSIVHNGEIVHTGGDGYADVQDQVPADPENTLFRIGSVTKLFTWTAAMQLVEDGELELDEDLSEYLPDGILNDDRDDPVTMSQLMSHTAGFDERIVGLFAEDADDVDSLESTLGSELPPRIREPGEYSSYANHAMGIPGYVIEQITGESWEAYVEENILDPLQMQRTTPRQPVPDEIDAEIAVGYEDAGGELEERDFENVGVPPAGSISSTADDMARFMIAHLQDGEFEGHQMLEPETAELMHSQHFAHDPEVNGWAHGFMEREYSDQRFIGHDGATLVFVSNLWLDKEEDLGIFLSYNTREGGGESGLEFIQEFTDRYYGASGQYSSGANTGTENRIAEITGSYRPIQLPESNIDKIVQLMGAASVEQVDERTIRLNALEADPVYFEETAPYEFRQVDEETFGSLIFRERSNSGEFDLFVRNSPETAWEPVPWHEGQFFNLVFFATAMVLFLSAVVTWPVQAYRRRKEPVEIGSTAFFANHAGGLTALLYILFVVFLAVALSDDPMEIAFGVPTIAAVGLGLAIVAALLSVPTLGLAIVSWVRGHWSLLGRIHLTLVAIAAVAMIWWLYQWNLLGFQY